MDVNKTLNFNIIPEFIPDTTASLKVTKIKKINAYS